MTPPHTTTSTFTASRQADCTSGGGREPADETLVRRVRGGDDAALETLVERYRSFLAYKARQYYLPGGDADDLVQEGMIGLYKAICHFDLAGPHPFAAFAKLCTTRQMQTAIGAATRRKHAPLNSSVELSADDPHILLRASSEVEDPATAVMASDGVARLTRYCQMALTCMEQQVLLRHLEGQAYETIAGAIGSNLKSVDNALQRARRKVARFHASSEMDHFGPVAA